MEITFQIDSLQKGQTIVTDIDGKKVTLQILEVQDNNEQINQNLFLKELKSAQKKLKGSVSKYENPMEPAVSESDWEIYKS